MFKLPPCIIALWTLVSLTTYLSGADNREDSIGESDLQIVGGMDAAIDDYPWMGAIVYNAEGDNSL